MRFIKNNGLTIVLVVAFIGSLLGMWLSGWRQENLDLVRHGMPTISLAAYSSDEAFLSALFENWESEWLQMVAYVLLTAILFQKGSAESRDPDKARKEAISVANSNYPAWARGSSLTRWLYRYSLGLVLASLFVFSFVGHLITSCASHNSQAAEHGEAKRSILEHLVNSQFWFESFQNWQSEFISTATLVVLSIFLRFHGSPESKPVSASDADSGA